MGKVRRAPRGTQADGWMSAMRTTVQAPRRLLVQVHANRPSMPWVGRWVFPVPTIAHPLSVLSGEMVVTLLRVLS